jgi:hypothetical protein
MTTDAEARYCWDAPTERERKLARKYLKARIGDRPTAVCHRCGCADTDEFPVSMTWWRHEGEPVQAERRGPVHDSPGVCIAALKGYKANLDLYVVALGGNPRLMTLVQP